MRGTLRLTHSIRKAEGIIPAHAGNTQRRVFARLVAEDHPRTCGEHMLIAPTVSRLQGSSPHMRGTQAGAHGARRTHGIIPAHAGNTCHVRCPSDRIRDHPRTCGEHWINARRNPKIMGSSPHMRGTRHAQGRNHRRRGIIPVHAGNTDFKFNCYTSEQGSSPHMRGTQIKPYIYLYTRRIIPAHAGNTCLLHDFVSSIADHPRTCGEHLPHSTDRR